MTLEVMMALLFISSTLTSLTVECIKRFYNDANKEYSANVITGVVALVVGFGVGITYWGATSRGQCLYVNCTL